MITAVQLLCKVIERLNSKNIGWHLAIFPTVSAYGNSIVGINI